MWFKLPLLPSEFIESDILTKIGDSLGKFLLSSSFFEDGALVVKICVLTSPKISPPKFYNIQSPFGLWRQNLVRDSRDFGCSAVIMDSPMFFHMKSICFGLGGVESPFDENVDTFTYNKVQLVGVVVNPSSPMKKTFTSKVSAAAPKNFVPSPRIGQSNAPPLKNPNNTLNLGLSSEPMVELGNVLGAKSQICDVLHKDMGVDTISDVGILLEATSQILEVLINSDKPVEVDVIPDKHLIAQV